MYIGPTIKNLIEPPRSIVNSRNSRLLNRPILNSHENSRYNERPIIDPIIIDNSTNEANTSSFNPTIQRSPNYFRKELLKSLRSKYYINEYDNINIRLDNLESSTDLLLYWIIDASAEDLLKNPIIILNDK